MSRKKEVRGTRSGSATSNGTSSTRASSATPARARQGAEDVTGEVEEVLFSRAGYLIRRLNQIHYAMFFQECGHENITPVQYGILTAIHMRADLGQTEISAYLGLDRTTTADVIHRLEKKGLLTRRVDENDRRARKIFITPEGAGIAASAYAGVASASERLLRPLSPAKRKLFLEMMTELVVANDDYGRRRQPRV